jgi:hypothetical protein
VGTFGEKLRKQREQRGLALDAISNTTKISTRMLRALEDEHFDQLPGGVFNKGFVRAYARQVGLDEEETITDYLAALRESQVQSQKILPDFRTPAGKSGPITSPDARHHILPASDHPSGDGGKGNGSHDLPAEERRRKEERRNEIRRNRDRGQDNKAPLTAGNLSDTREAAGRDRESREADSSPQIAREHDRPQQASQLGNHRNEERPHHGSSSLPGFITLAPATESSTESSDAPSSRISRSMLAAALILILTVGLAVWNSQRHRDSGSDSARRAVSSSPSAPISAQLPVPTLTSAATGSPNIGPASGAKPSVVKSPAAPRSSSTKPASANSAPKPAANPSVDDSFVAPSTTHTLAAKPLTTFTVTIRADQTTWVSITADGKPVATETLIAPAHTSVRAARDVAVKVGNAAGVSFVLNGKEFPPQGNVGEVRTYFFDATGLRAMPQPPSPTPNP